MGRRQRGAQRVTTARGVWARGVGWGVRRWLGAWVMARAWACVAPWRCAARAWRWRQCSRPATPAQHHDRVRGGTGRGVGQQGVGRAQERSGAYVQLRCAAQVCGLNVRLVRVRRATKVCGVCGECGVCGVCGSRRRAARSAPPPPRQHPSAWPSPHDRRRHHHPPPPPSPRASRPCRSGVAASPPHAARH